MIKKLINSITKALFPEDIKCIVCHKDLRENYTFDVCPNCIKEIPFNNKGTCLKCGKNTWAGATHCSVCKKHLHIFNKARAPLLYVEPISFYMPQFKYANYKYLAKPFAKFIFNEYLLSNFEVDVVYPVPMYYSRKIVREYNHAEELAKHFCQMANLPLDTTNFVRIVNTEQQARMAKKEREENLKNAFRVIDPSLVKDKKVLLIDDIITTGSTIDECAKVLYKCGAKEVNALAVAHRPEKLYLLKQNVSTNDAKTFDKMSKIMYNTQVKTNKFRVLPSFRNMKRFVSNEIDRSYRRRK